MKKVVLASLLAVAGTASLAAQTPVNLGTPGAAPAPAPAAATPGPAAASNPCAVPASGVTTPSLGTGAAGGNVQMSQDEYALYNKAATETTPAAKAEDFDAYLKAYPKSAVKADALQQEMFAWSQANNSQKTQDTADELLALDPCNLYALVFEVSLRQAAASQLTDPAAKLAGLDKAAAYAETGLVAPKPKAMSDADFQKLKAQGYPVFYSAIGADDLQKKDMAGAVKAYTSELQAVPLQATETPGPQLMDTYYLASAYYQQTPANFLDCAYYAARAANYAPEPFKTTFTKLGQYCYTKYHGKPDGYDAVVAMAKDNLMPPATFASSVTPAPKPEDLVQNLIATTPDLATLAISDKEFVLQYGKPADADKVFDTIKGKSVELPGVTVISATPDTVTVAVSDDAVQSKTADFTFNMKEPIKDADMPAVGSTVTIDGTYASYTQKPLMITMTDGALVLPKKAAPVHHHPTHR